MTTKNDVLNMLDRSDTVSDPDYASRLIARANVLALLLVAEQLESLAENLDMIAGNSGIIHTRDADAI
jgi:hypothetical protein